MIPFTCEALDAFCNAHQVSKTTRALIDESLKAPARRVRPGKRNSKSTVACPKMGFVLTMESNLERASALDHLFDDDVVGYIEQPQTKLHLAYERDDRRRSRTSSTPDFLVFHKRDGLIIEECKPMGKIG